MGLALAFAPSPALADSVVGAASTSGPATEPANGAITGTDPTPSDEPARTPGDELAGGATTAAEPATEPAPTDDPTASAGAGVQRGEEAQAGDPNGSAPPPDTGTAEPPDTGSRPDPATAGKQAPAPSAGEQPCAELTPTPPVNAQPATGPPCAEPAADTPPGAQPPAEEPRPAPPGDHPAGHAFTSPPIAASSAPPPPGAGRPRVKPRSAPTVRQHALGVPDPTPRARAVRGAPARHRSTSAAAPVWLMSVGLVPPDRLTGSPGRNSDAGAANDAGRAVGAARRSRSDSQPPRHTPIAPPLPHTAVAASAGGSSSAQQALLRAILFTFAALAAYELRRFRFRLLVPAAPGAPSLRDRPG
jgi:hypothetical protein